MKPALRLEAAYLKFRIRLEVATGFDLAAYADWVRDHAVALSIGFTRSGEDDAAVYGRMQYARSTGIGV